MHTEVSSVVQIKQFSNKGQAMVEFAVSLVLLLIILSGIIDLGRMFFYYIAMRDASQEGVMYGTINPSNCDQIEARVRTLLSDNTGVDVTITVNGADCSTADPTTDACSGNELVVSVIDPDFPISMPFLGAVLGRNSITLDATITGTILRPQCE